MKRELKKCDDERAFEVAVRLIAAGFSDSTIKRSLAVNHLYYANASHTAVLVRRAHNCTSEERKKILSTKYVANTLQNCAS